MMYVSKGCHYVFNHAMTKRYVAKRGAERMTQLIGFLSLLLRPIQISSWA